MTTSSYQDGLYIWVFLPGEKDPVVAGRLHKSEKNKGSYDFYYGKSYLARSNAVPIYGRDLPLKPGNIETPIGFECPNSIRDGSPDAWGRRVIIHSIYGVKGSEIDTVDLSEIEYMLRSGSDRIGAVDFQESATEYIPRDSTQSSLEDLLSSAERIEKGQKLSPDLIQAIQYGTPVGGARPKALITEENTKFIAKFSTSEDLFSVVKGEFVAMRLAQLAGLDVANVMLKRTSGKDVLLVERFDRDYKKNAFIRKRFVSGLTLFGVTEMQSPYVSYEELAEIILYNFAEPDKQIEELFKRMTFNIICGNTDDHARNHGALIQDDETLILSPGYDICPQRRVGQEASQAMRLSRRGHKLSKLSLCLEIAPIFKISTENARQMIIDQIESIGEHWSDVCNEAKMSEVDRTMFIGNQFFNPFSYEDLEDKNIIIKDTVKRTLEVMHLATVR